MQNGIRHRLLAILAADAVGYSRSMSFDDLGTLSALDEARQVFRSHVEAASGRVVDTSGDSVLAVFDTAIGAVRAAVEIQEDLATRADAAPEHLRLLFRIGIHVGDLIEKPDGTVYGDGVNIASRLQAVAEPGGVVVSHAVQEFASDRTGAAFEDIGQQKVKNIAKSISALRLLRAPRVTRTDELARAPLVEQARITHRHFAPNAVDVTVRTSRRARRWRWVGSGALVVVTFLAAGAAWQWHATPTLNIDEEVINRRALAVLALNDKRGKAAGSSLGDDLADSIGAQLVRGGVRVIERGATVRQDPAAPEFERIGREQAVRFVLGGRVIRDRDAVRVTTYLTEIASGAVYRLHEAEFKSDDDATRSNYGHQVAIALTARYYEIETVRARLPGHEKDPVDAIVLAWRDLNRGNTKEDLERARHRFEFAAKADPNSVDASVGLGVAHMMEFYYFYSESPRDKLDITEKVLKRALDLGPGNAQNLSAWAEMLILRQKPEEAFWVWRRAFEINPDYQIGHLRMASALIRQGRLAEALEHINKVNDLQAYQTHPQQWLIQSRADAAFAQGHDDQAYEILRNWAAEFPNNGRPYLMLAAIDALHGRKAAAAANMAKHRQLVPLSNIDYVVLTYPSTDPGFLAQRERLVAGLRRAGLPEDSK
ncbi:Adenylate cyclase, class 3 [Variovorax sp. CF079]|uniref:adenylate/guanylate cyclase domain-containing protein n=1 Tax=Variovorax sp. CF079 TaxID=1882774 RepID=UPI000891A404|nr:adenylate/guanylate cyclase domain-containing protein [Variovorax sp. CF079]SDC24145.1 Adenylate cyclase, class 3 [Variovorax sp. CF079]